MVNIAKTLNHIFSRLRNIFSWETILEHNHEKHQFQNLNDITSEISSLSHQKLGMTCTNFGRKIHETEQANQEKAQYPT